MLFQRLQVLYAISTGRVHTQVVLHNGRNSNAISFPGEGGGGVLKPCLGIGLRLGV